MKLPSLYIFIFLFLQPFFGQKHFPNNGVKDKNNNYIVFKNATIHVSPTKTIEKGSLLIQNGKIINVGEVINTPKNCVVHDLKGKHIYNSFIEVFSSFGLPSIQKKERPKYPQYKSSRKGPYYWNEAIHPSYNSIDQYSYDSKASKIYKEKGVGAVLSHLQDGIARGTGFLTTLNKEKNKSIITSYGGCFYSFKKGSSTQVYPSSLMGCIALLRQFYYDIHWYEYQKTESYEDLSVKAMLNTSSTPQFFITNNHQDILRANEIAQEFNLNYIIKGGGDEYQIINELKASSIPLIIPINFPKAYDVEDPYDALNITTKQLLHWKNAPKNLALLEQNNINCAITSDGLNAKDFIKNIRTAIKNGLSKEYAYRALTIAPAKMLNLEDELGTLEKGKWANFIITSSEFFEGEGEIIENWVQGEQNIIQSKNEVDIRGIYNLNINQNIRSLIVNGTYDTPKATLEYNLISDSISNKGDLVIDGITGKPYKLSKKKSLPVQIRVEGYKINFSFTINKGVYRLAGNINYNSGSWDGNGQMPSGEWTKWTAIRKKKNKLDAIKIPVLKDTNSIIYKFPMTSYGWDSLPKQVPVLIKNATVWTSEEEGILYNTDLLIRDGEITHLGKILDVVDEQTIRIDGTGKHITAGLIDEHSHIAIKRGVNEGSHAVSAEVRIGDVINPEDINIYRQIAGGVTTSQLLHGSANPIGGQSAIIKLRWGENANEMKFKNASKFIKFALGENVKQSNWGDRNVIRFPQTRMGVEQLYYANFIAAKEYGRKWSEYENSNKKNKSSLEKPKIDLQMEALLEILNGDRFITCHSYVQSEINMLMKVADSLGFTLNTFTHILEGYKVADKMKEHGAGGSSFSDWWAYKYEVKDAIPHNASLLNSMGIVVAINSDDAEMGRRLNHEAAKGIKYGGMSEEDALNMVTINPAKLLHLDDHIGSIKVGKDADLVIWSGHPLSVYSKVEKTYIDGKLYFDLNSQHEKEKTLQQERASIIAEMIAEKKSGKATQKIKIQKKNAHVCGLINDDGN